MLALRSPYDCISSETQCKVSDKNARVIAIPSLGSRTRTLVATTDRYACRMLAYIANY